MVKKTKISNKEGADLQTKKGEQMFDYKFEVGDIFIPCNNSISSKTHEAVMKTGEKKKITSYKLKCKVLGYQNEEDIFVSLTPSQAESLSRKIKEEVVLNQHLFCAFEYTGKDENKYIGVGFKKARTPMKSFDDFQSVISSED